jgi:hypothetical protein
MDKDIPQSFKDGMKEIQNGKITDMFNDLPDTGGRTEYSTGAVRDASIGKGHWHAIPRIALQKLGERFEGGAKKYTRNNWMKGIPLSHYQDSLMRHTQAWAEGDTKEDHMGAIIWNSVAACWTEDQILAGKLPKELDDLPYRPENLARLRNNE